MMHRVAAAPRSAVLATVLLAACSGGDTAAPQGQSQAPSADAPPADAPPADAPPADAPPADAPPEGTLSLSLSAPSGTVAAGGSLAVSVAVAASGLGGPVSLSAQGLPAGVAAAFSPASLQATGSATLTFSADAGAAGASVTVTVEASGGGLTQSASYELTVTPAGPAGDDPDVQRRATFTAVEDQIVELEAQGKTGVDLVHAVADYMATRPEYVATGVDEDSLSASGRFADGRLHVVALGSDPGPPEKPVRLAAPALLPSGGEVPQSAFARLITSFSRPSAVADAESYLTQQGWTVTPHAPDDAGVAKLRAISGDGYFVFTTTGGVVPATINPETEPGGEVYALASSTIQTPELDKQADNADDLLHHRLAYITVLNGKMVSSMFGAVAEPATDTRYGVTYHFVEQYWRFAPNAVVWINANSSATSGQLALALLQKGVNVFLGWSGRIALADTWGPLRFFTDRMVGSNVAWPETPFQRPFAYPLVLADMTKRGLLPTPSGASLKAAAAPGVAPAALAPSIRNLIVDEQNGLLKLFGDFGSAVPRVTVDGMRLDPASPPSPGEIDCTLPTSGPGSSGDVMVSVQGIQSNVRQLTQWTLTVRYDWSNPGGLAGLLIDGQMTLRFRGDIGGFRDQPATPLRYLVRGMTPTRDSALPLTASGTSKQGTCTATLSGSGTFVPAPGGWQLVAAMKIDDTDPSGPLGAALGLAFGLPGPTSPFTLTYSGASGCTATVPFAPTFGLLGGVVDFPQTQSESSPTFPLPAMSFDLDSSWSVPTVDRHDPSVGGDLELDLFSSEVNDPPRYDDPMSGR